MTLKSLIGVGAVLACMASACSSKVTQRTVVSPVAEQRQRLDASEPVISGEWTLEGRVVTGRLHFSSCASERRWTTSLERIEHRQSPRELGWLLFGAGSVVETVGIVARENELGTPAPATMCPVPDLYDSCKPPSTPDTSESTAAIVVGAVAAVTGAVILLAQPKDRTTVLKSELHTESTRGPCILPRDFSTLVLVLKLGENRYVHVDVDESGNAHVALPPAARLTPGTDLPVLVYRGPAALADALPRMQTVGSVHVPE